jgi:integrase/recombinase XerD
MKIAQAVAAYVVSKQSLGMRFATEATTLKSFCRFIGDIDIDEIDPGRVRSFLDGNGPVTWFWHRKLSALRGLYRFSIAREYVTTSPLPTMLPQQPQLFVPYIYSLDEVRRLIEATTSREHRSFSALTCRTLLLLLYGTGVRISEALGLDVGDVDLEAQLLRIRDTKFYKTRLVPIGSDLTKILATYASQRDKRLPTTTDAAFLVTRKGIRPSRAGAESVFKQLREVAMVRRNDGARYQPRLHDMRHTFATTCLIRWYREGADVQRLLPQLATYLGHVHIGGTQRYLSMTPELLRHASVRFERYAMGGNDHG